MISLYDAYGRFSDRKRDAWEYCEKKCSSLAGVNLKVITYNDNVFTAGFEYRDTDDTPMFMYITPSYDIAIYME